MGEERKHRVRIVFARCNAGSGSAAAIAHDASERWYAGMQEPPLRTAKLVVGTATADVP